MSTPNRPRVLLISHSCRNQAEGHRRAELIHVSGEVDLLVLVPDRWCSYGKWGPVQVPAALSFPFTVGKVALPWVAKIGFYLHFYPGLKKLLYEFRPDIVDVWEEPWGLLSVQVALLRRKHFPKAKLLLETEQNLRKAIPPPFKQFWKFSVRQADFLVGRSEEALDVSRSHGYRGLTAVIANGVDTDVFVPRDRTMARARFGIPTDQFVIGYAGRLVPEKGLMDLLDATALVPNVHTWLVGSGSHKGELKVRASQPDLVGRVHFLGAQPPNSLCELMNAFDVFVLPSRTAPNWKEQFGRVLAEAGACGIPVIGSDSGAIPDVVGNAGLIYPECQPAELAKSITMLRDSPELRSTFGEAGRKQAIEKYSWERVASDYLHIFKTLTHNEDGE
jgi:glycosyltransferase involved in cell wall biosynthesis